MTDKPTARQHGDSAARPWWWAGLVALYQVLLPMVLLMALPGWWIRMLRRGGQGSGLHERAGVYVEDPAWEPCGAVHLHAISVGEVMLALRLMRAWREKEPAQKFVLATGTATGRAVAVAAGLAGVRVTYAPLDIPVMVHAYLRRFEPSKLILVEGEVWPNLMSSCERRGIPVSLVNARMSPRSERRYRKLAPCLRPLFSLLRHVAIQEEEHREIWQWLGVGVDRIVCTGSLKFDPGSHPAQPGSPEIAGILTSMGDAPVLLAASTHPGEEVLLAKAMHRAVPEARLVIAPRHAERAEDCLAELVASGFRVMRRSHARMMDPPSGGGPLVLLIDTTGELREWIGHADVVLIGKSFRSRGGQNPAEAIMAGVPVVFGPHMENFEPLATRLLDQGGALRAEDPEEMVSAICHSLQPDRARAMAQAASACLRRHEGATRRMVDLVCG